MRLDHLLSKEQHHVHRQLSVGGVSMVGKASVLALWVLGGLVETLTVGLVVQGLKIVWHVVGS